MVPLSGGAFAQVPLGYSVWLSNHLQLPCYDYGTYVKSTDSPVIGYWIAGTSLAFGRLCAGNDAEGNAVMACPAGTAKIEAPGYRPTDGRIYPGLTVQAEWKYSCAFFGGCSWKWRCPDALNQIGVVDGSQCVVRGYTAMLCVQSNTSDY